MAAWHYRCELVPIANFLKYHSVIPERIKLDVEDSEYIDYWDMKTSLVEKIKQDFSTYYLCTETWGNSISFTNSVDSMIKVFPDNVSIDNKLFHEFYDSVVEVFPDSVSCKLNLFYVDMKFLGVLANVTKANKCLFTSVTENGKVFEPTLENLLYEMKHSYKHNFLAKWRASVGK